MRSSPASHHFLPLRSKYSPQHHAPNTFNLCPSLIVRDQVSHPQKITGEIIVLHTLVFEFLGADGPRSKCHTHFLLSGSFERTHPSPKHCATFRNKLVLYGEELLASRSTIKLEGCRCLAVHDCLFNIFSATHHIWRPSPPSATRRRTTLSHSLYLT